MLVKKSLPASMIAPTIIVPRSDSRSWCSTAYDGQADGCADRKAPSLHCT